jgi:ssDNA-binding Zn-finger/Zn-ribbon topoisomerase 1
MTKTVSLKVKCPHCGKSLMDSETMLHDAPSIKLNIETVSERGTIRLCSIYGCYDHLCDFDLKKDEIARFYCPKCNKELTSNDHCDAPNCNAPMIPFTLELGGKVFICSRCGCNNHFVAFENLETQLRKFYHEYGEL